MKAVFLDAGTFSQGVDLSLPAGISDYTKYDFTDNDTDIIVHRCQDADIIITNKVLITRAVIERLPKLKLVHVTATGTNNIDTIACQEHGVPVMNVAGYSTVSVPEHTFMLLLNIMRAARHYHEQISDGTWQQSARFCLLDTPILDLADKTLGIIGAGSIGRRVGQIAQAFGMKVLYAERQNATPRDDSYTAFDDVLAQADVLTLHCPLTDLTHHLINQDTIAKMKDGVMIVNVARGGVVDSQAVADGINSGKIAGYGTDVFEQEPYQDDEPLATLAHHPRVFFTPHNAWASLGAQKTLWQILYRQIEQFITQ